MYQSSFLPPLLNLGEQTPGTGLNLETKKTNNLPLRQPFSEEYSADPTSPFVSNHNYFGGSAAGNTALTETRKKLLGHEQSTWDEPMHADDMATPFQTGSSVMLPNSSTELADQAALTSMSAASSSSPCGALEAGFGEVLGLLNNVDKHTAPALYASSPKELQKLCRAGAAALRLQASRVLHVPARAQRLHAQAQDLDLEASTWGLLWQVFGEGCEEERVKGLGAAPPVTLAERVRAHARRGPSQEDTPAAASRKWTTFTCNRVIAWLEELAGERVDGLEGRSEGGGRQARFTEWEGVWRETRQALQHKGTTQQALMLRELDPDAVTRERGRLHDVNLASDERILLECWQQVRAGRVREAWAVCREAGQAWREVLLGGGVGPGGVTAPVPVGAAADQECHIQHHNNPILASEGVRAVSEGEIHEHASPGGGLEERAWWKWALYQAAEAAREAAAGGGRGGMGGAGRVEAALYGAVCGNASLMMPLAQDWECACWVLFRHWLEHQVDCHLEEENQYMQGQQVEGEEVADADDSFAGLDLPQRAPDILGLTQGQREGASGAEHLFEHMWRHAEAEGGQLGRELSQRQRRLQRLLILLRFSEMSGEEERVFREEQVVREVQSWLGPQEESAVGMFNSGADDSEDTAGPPAAHLVRFCAHVMLWLAALTPGGDSQEPSSPFSPANPDFSKVLNMYVVQLISQQQYPLVPLYARHLRSEVLEPTYATFLEMLLSAPLPQKQLILAQALQSLPASGSGSVHAAIGRLLTQTRQAALRIMQDGLELEAEGESGAVPPGCYLESCAEAAVRAVEWASCLRAPHFPPHHSMARQAARHALTLLRELVLGDQLVAAKMLVMEVLAPEWVDLQLWETSAASLDQEGEDTDGAHMVEWDVAAELSGWVVYLEVHELLLTRERLLAGEVLGGGGDESGGGDGITGVRAAEMSLCEEAVCRAEALLRHARGQGPGMSGASNAALCQGWLDGLGGEKEEEMLGSPTCLSMVVFARHHSESGGTGTTLGRATATASLLRHALQEAAKRLNGVSMEIHVKQTGTHRLHDQSYCPVFQIEVKAINDMASSEFPGWSAARQVAHVAAKALKGDLLDPATSQPVRHHLEVCTLDCQPPEVSRQLCRHVMLPHLLLQVARAEAALGEGHGRVLQMVAGNLYQLFSKMQLKQLLHFDRWSAIENMENAVLTSH